MEDLEELFAEVLESDFAETFDETLESDFAESFAESDFAESFLVVFEEGFFVFKRVLGGDDFFVGLDDFAETASSASASSTFKGLDAFVDFDADFKAFVAFLVPLPILAASTFVAILYF